MDAKYRILHLITRLELGGAQQNTLYCIANHDRESFDVGLIAGRGGLLDEEAYRIQDARVQLVPYLKHPISPLSDVRAIFELRAYFRSHGIDLVHTHSSKAGVVGRLAAHLAGVPVIVHTAHGWSFNATQSPWRRTLYVALERWIGGITDRLLVVAEGQREQGLRHGIGDPERYALLRSGIDPDEFATPRTDPSLVRRGMGFEDKHTVVGTVACMKPQKAPLDFIRAAAIAYEDDPGLRFFVAGDGQLMPQARALVNELGLESVVCLLGWRNDVVDLLHAMDVFLLTSLFEGLPRVVLQAVAAGIPVVATAVDGTPEVIEDGVSGLLVPPGRPELAARKILEMTRDAALRHRCVAGARSRLTEEFDVRGMVHELDELYLDLLKRRGV